MLALALLVWATCASAADPAEPITRVSVNQVRIDATVTDSHGNAVHDLNNGDFEVFQDGKLQKPVSVEYIAEGAEPATPRRELSAGDVKRTIVVLLDDADMSFETFYYARKAVEQTLEKAMQPGDVVAILRTMETASYENQFLSDPAAVRLTIDKLSYRLPLPRFVAIPPVLGLLRSTLAALSRMPGRKSVVIFGGGLGTVNFSDGLALYNKLADSALRSAVRIYGIDSRGLTIRAPVVPRPLGVNAPGKQEPGLNGMAGPSAYAITPGIGNMGGLAMLAEDTGGLVLENSNDLGGELRQALADQLGFYLIAWDPGKRAFEPDKKGSFADFHKISVKVTRPGMKVRMPRGFYGIDSGTLPAGVSPQVAMQEALFAPFQSGGFNTQMTSGFFTNGGAGFIRSFVYIDGKDIQFAPYGEDPKQDCHAASLEVLTVPQAFDAKVDTLAESQIVGFHVCGTGYQEMVRNGMALSILLPVSQPGGYEMRMAVRNVDPRNAQSSLAKTKGLLTRQEIGQPVGSAHELVVVPAWHKGPAAFGLAIHSNAVQNSVVPPKQPDDTDKTAILEYRVAVPGDPAVRDFRPGEELQYQAETANVADAKAQIRVTRVEGASQTEVYARDMGPVENGALSGLWMIGSSFAPGIYDLQLTITGKDEKGRPYRGTQQLDFTVAKRGGR